MATVVHINLTPRAKRINVSSKIEKHSYTHHMQQFDGGKAKAARPLGQQDESEFSSLPDTPMSRAQVEKSYRRYAPIYDLLFGASLGQGRRAMTKLVRTLNPSKILEVGVGTGLTLGQYPATSLITGVDVSQEMLKVAGKRVQGNDAGRIILTAMDAEAMDFETDSFDCVTVPYVLSVTPNPDRLVHEIRRVCRPGGDIVIVNHFSGQAPWRFLEALARPLSGWLGFRSDFSMERHVLSYDWKVESIAPTNLLALSRLIHIRNV